MLNNRYNISKSLIASLVALGLGGLIVLVYFFGVVAALLGPGTGDVEPDAKLAQYITDNEKKLAEYEQSFNGRSVFYIPPARRPPPPPVVVRPEPQIDYKPEPLPPPPPSTYTGQSPVWAIGDEVWFREKKQGDPMTRLRVGEEIDGVTLVRVNLPKEIVVRQHGKEFTLPILKSFSWGSDANKVLGSDAGNSRSGLPDGMRIVGDNQPSMSASEFEKMNSSGQASAAATLDDEFVGPPVPTDLDPDVADAEPEPIPDVEVVIENDPADEDAQPVDSQDVAGNLDNEAEQAAQDEAGETPADDDEADPQQPGSDDPDNPGAPPE